jgi:hypothetical protein
LSFFETVGDNEFSYKHNMDHLSKGLTSLRTLYETQYKTTGSLSKYAPEFFSYYLILIKIEDFNHLDVCRFPPEV